MPTLQLYFSTHPNGSQMRKLNALGVFFIKGISNAFFVVNTSSGHLFSPTSRIQNKTKARSFLSFFSQYFYCFLIFI